jgi:hypothetical protein
MDLQTDLIRRGKLPPESFAPTIGEVKTVTSDLAMNIVDSTDLQAFYNQHDMTEDQINRFRQATANTGTGDGVGWIDIGNGKAVRMRVSEWEKLMNQDPNFYGKFRRLKGGYETFTQPKLAQLQTIKVGDRLHDTILIGNKRFVLKGGFKAHQGLLGELTKLPIVDIGLEGYNQLNLKPFSSSERFHSASRATLSSLGSATVGYVVTAGLSTSCVAGSAPAALATATPCVLGSKVAGAGASILTAKGIEWVYDEARKFWAPQGACYRKGDGEQYCQYPGAERPRYSHQPK